MLPGAALGNALRPPGLSRRPARFLRTRWQLVVWSLALVPVLFTAGAITIGDVQPLLQAPVLAGTLASLLASALGARIRPVGAALLVLLGGGFLAAALALQSYPASAGDSLGRVVISPAGENLIRSVVDGQALGSVRGESAVPLVEGLSIDGRFFMSPRLRGFRLAGVAGLQSASGDLIPSGDTLRIPVSGLSGRLIDAAPGLLSRSDLALPDVRPIPGIPTRVGVHPDGRRIVLR